MSGGISGNVDLLPAARVLGAARILYKSFTQKAILAGIDRVRAAEGGVAVR